MALNGYWERCSGCERWLQWIGDIMRVEGAKQGRDEMDNGKEE